MPRQLTEHERQAFLAEPRVAVVGVAAEEGRPPLVTPTWYAYEPGGTITFFTGAQGGKPRKKRLIAKASVLTLSVQHGEVPYKYVTVEGTVVKTDQPPSPDQMLAVVLRYLPEDYAQGFVQSELAHPGA